MDVVEDLLELDWDGPLSAVSDFPAVLLYGAVLTFAVAKGPDLLQAVKAALEPLFGSAAERRSLLGGRRLEWSGKVSAEAAVRGGQVSLHLGQRVKGKRLEEAVQALAGLPDARHLRLKAGVRRFQERPDSAPIG
jgi:hypothetical protein